MNLHPLPAVLASMTIVEKTVAIVKVLMLADVTRRMAIALVIPLMAIKQFLSHG